MVGEAEARLFVGWEEVAVSNDKGRRVVNYYVKDSDGRRDLAVVGREKSLRHMSYVVRNQFLESVLLAGRGSSSSAAAPLAGVGFECLKWKSRREVVDWLSEIVSDSVSPGPSLMGDGFLNDDVVPRYNTTGKGLSPGKMTHHSKDFSWLGSPWNCRKRRKHYRSFCRNKITISVHDYVYVMAEEGKRLVAYVEDLYEDMRANNMVVVRWFHKVDEVGIVLPPDVHDREIFFSLCLQDFSVECIDGLASVLSAQDFDKFQNEARHRFSSWEPYLCRRQIDNDDVKPFDITQVQGYWSQEVLRSMYATSGTSLKVRLKITHRGSSSSVDQDGYIEPKKKKQRLNDETINATGMSKDVIKKPQSLTSAGSRVPRPASGYATPDMLRKQLFKHKLQQQQQQLAKGCHVEVLSQDSGLRGCWFRCVVLKRHQDKVKVQYQDVQDADDTGKLEEWVLASRVASPDRLSIRLCGRSVVRPDPSQGTKSSCSLGVGSVVDAWWHDCWWEGIIIEKASEEKIRVYFPGEQLFSTFTLSDLRPSQEWLGNKWNPIKDRPEMAGSLLSDMDKCLPRDGNIPVRASVSNQEVEADVQWESLAACKSSPLLSGKHSVQRETEAVVPNLARGLDGLHWNKYKKRKHLKELGKGGSGPRCKRQFGGSTSSSSSPEAEEGYNSGGEFLMPKSLTVDHENCKIGGDPLFAPPLALCSSLVMSQ